LKAAPNNRASQPKQPIAKRHAYQPHSAPTTPGLSALNGHAGQPEPSKPDTKIITSGQPLSPTPKQKETVMRILIAEDDQVLADGLLRTLRSAGAAVDHVASGNEADAALMTNNEFDLLILDLGLPKMHGLEVLKRLRARGSVLPVLILTAADSVEERVKGLDYGADDYMAKPFSLQELEARVRALTRRGMGGATSQIKHGPLIYDQSGRVATIDGKMVELSARELGLLEVLLQRAGRLVSKDQLVERLCEWGEEVSNNAIEVYIHRLRKKIEKGPIRIATVRGLGYCLEKIPG
jgi:two-component system, OmpR family, response regulator